MTDVIRVYLWAVGNPVIIVPAPSGVVYCNQVDGTATEARELEGFVLPLPRIEVRVFDPSWWRRRPRLRHQTNTDVFDEIEVAIQSLVSSGEIPRNVTVDRDAPDNAEAWINVRFTFPRLGPDADETGVTAMKGILTWENCD